MSKKKILIVDDSKDIREALVEIFAADYEMHEVVDGQAAIDSVESIQPDLILLDIMMPRMDGFQTCLRLRQMDVTRTIPIIFLTTKNEPQTETFGLELGADDFVHKPFNPDVLRARVKKRLDSGAVAPKATGEQTKLDDYTIQWERQEILHGDVRISLTTKELGLLRLFVQNEGKVLSREVILDRVWSETYITDRTIDSHVKELRKKIPPLVSKLKTVYGAGYRLDL